MTVYAQKNLLHISKFIMPQNWFDFIYIKYGSSFTEILVIFKRRDGKISANIKSFYVDTHLRNSAD